MEGKGEEEKGRRGDQLLTSCDWRVGEGSQTTSPPLLWDNLHPTAIFSAKYQLTRPILHYKLGLPDPLGSVCGCCQKKS